MSIYFDKVKNYLLNLEFNIVHEDIEGEIFVVENPQGAISNLVIDCEAPILIIEGVLCELAKDEKEVYKSLLIKNREIVHGALVLDETGKQLMFRDTLQIENLDENELEGTLNSLELLLGEYSDKIIEFSK